MNTWHSSPLMTFILVCGIHLYRYDKNTFSHPLEILNKSKKFNRRVGEMSQIFHYIGHIQRLKKKNKMKNKKYTQDFHIKCYANLFEVSTTQFFDSIVARFLKTICEKRRNERFGWYLYRILLKWGYLRWRLMFVSSEYRRHRLRRFHYSFGKSSIKVNEWYIRKVRYFFLFFFFVPEKER